MCVTTYVRTLLPPGSAVFIAHTCTPHTLQQLLHIHRYLCDKGEAKYAVKGVGGGDLSDKLVPRGNNFLAVFVPVGVGVGVGELFGYGTFLCSHR